MAGTSNSITTHNVLNGVLNADNVISGLVNTAFNPAYALVTQAGAQIVLFINSSDYKMYAQLKDKSGNLIYTSNIIDLPLETMVVDGRYDSGTKKLILVLDNGNEIEVPLGALISGLVNENDLVANYYDKDEIDVLLDGYWTKIELTQEDIDNWNAKQEYLNQGDGIEISADTILKGNTYQESTTGKNLLKNTNVNSGDNNYWNSYSIYDKETGTLTRSTTETTENYIGHRINLKNDTKYTISCLAKSNGYVRSLDIYAYNSTTTKIYSKADISLTTNFQKYSFTFTTDSTDFTNSTIRFDNNGSTQSGTEAILTIKDVMLAEGEDTAYEPYTNGASPNPDYPQDIHVVSGDNTIKSCAKNLYNVNDRESVAQEVVIDNDSWISVSYDNTSGSSNKIFNCRMKPNIFLKPDTTYKIVVEVKSISGNGVLTINEGANQQSQIYDGFIKDFSALSSNSVVMQNAKTWASLEGKSRLSTQYVYFRPGQSGSITFRVSLIEDTTLTPSTFTYEPYQSQSYNVNLGSLELCKIRDYQDYFYKDNGKWYLHKEIGKVIIDENIVGGALTDSNQRIMFSSSSNPFISNVYIPTPSSVSNLTPSLSNYFSSSAQSEITPTNNKVGFSKWEDTTFVYFSAIYNSVEEFKNWLSTHNTIVYYVLATPTNTKITDSTLISQLNALTIGFSNNWVENVSQTNADLPFEIEYDNKNLTISASSNLVRNTDYATSNTGGVVKVQDTLGLGIGSTGNLFATTKTYTTYQTLSEGAIVGKGTLDNVLNAKIGNIQTLLDNLNNGNGVE